MTTELEDSIATTTDAQDATTTTKMIGDVTVHGNDMTIDALAHGRGRHLATENALAIVRATDMTEGSAAGLLGEEADVIAAPRQIETTREGAIPPATEKGVAIVTAIVFEIAHVIARTEEIARVNEGIVVIESVRPSDVLALMTRGAPLTGSTTLALLPRRLRLHRQTLRRRLPLIPSPEWTNISSKTMTLG